MLNNNDNLEIINPNSINTQESLDKLIARLGFISRTEIFANYKVIRKASIDFTNEPRVSLIAQDNNLDNHSFVAVEDSAFFVYYYDDPNDLYRIWDELRNNVQLSVLRETILSAMTNESLLKRLGY